MNRDKRNIIVCVAALCAVLAAFWYLVSHTVFGTILLWLLAIIAGGLFLLSIVGKFSTDGTSRSRQYLRRHGYLVSCARAVIEPGNVVYERPIVYATVSKAKKALLLDIPSSESGIKSGSAYVVPLMPAIKMDIGNFLVTQNGKCFLKMPGAELSDVSTFDARKLQQDITDSFEEIIDLYISQGRGMYAGWPSDKEQKQVLEYKAEKFLEKYLTPRLMDEHFVLSFERVFSSWLCRQEDERAGLALGVMLTTAEKRINYDQAWVLKNAGDYDMETTRFFESYFLPFASLADNTVKCGCVEAAVGSYAMLQRLVAEKYRKEIADRYGVDLLQYKNRQADAEKIFEAAEENADCTNADVLVKMIMYAYSGAEVTEGTDGVWQRYLLPATSRRYTFIEQWETQRQFYEHLVEIRTEKRRITRLEKSLSLEGQEKEVAINDTDLMSGQEFEQLVAHIMNKMGYTTRLTPTTGDQGVDIIAEKNEVRLGIQAKCYSGRVGNGAVQEVVAGMNFYGLNRAMVVTNNTFTESAQKLALANHVVLWDRAVLTEKLHGL